MAKLDSKVKSSPSMNTHSIESVIMYRGNNTSEWLREQSEEKQESIITKAMTNTQEYVKTVTLRKKLLIQQHLDTIRERQEQVKTKREKDRAKLVNAQEHIKKHGFWLNENDIDIALSNFKTKKDKITALKEQINLYKTLKTINNCDKHVLAFSVRGKAHDITTLKDHILCLIKKYHTCTPQSSSPLANPCDLLGKSFLHVWTDCGKDETWNGRIISFKDGIFYVKYWRCGEDGAEDDEEYELTLEELTADYDNGNLTFEEKPSSLFDHTNPDWVPTLKLGHSKISNCATEQDQKRHKRSVERQQKKRKLDAEFSMADLQNFQLVEGNEENEVSTDGTASQTDLSTNTISAMQSEIQRLLAENRALKEQINTEKSKFDRNFFQNDDEKVKYYTGLPDFSTLEIVCDYVDKYIPHNSANVLSKFQMAVLVLIKLRLNLSNIDIAQKFNISQSSVSRLFLNMIDILYFRLRPMIYWPDREQLRESMPMAFRTNYGTSVSVIVDCFEVFLERSSNLTARTLTWSSYKHNNTVKYLIGIAPQGVISFISKGWGGRASDKFVMESSVSRLFLNMIDILYFRLRPMIYWPDREQLRESMPMAFRTNYGTSVSVIVDCFEVFLERSSNLTARTLTWSSYKHNNTVKYLIGIAPQGVISFISKGWGGRASDKFVMENCGILKQLNPGDIVLADRGFDIADSVAMMGAKLEIPSFTRGKRQLSGEEVENTRRIANVRIHVERVIGSLRQKYCILQNTVPIDYVMSSDENTTTLDKMTLVCCALTNLCPSVVPID